MFSLVTAFCVLLAFSSYSFAQTENLPPGMPEVIRDLDRTASDAVKNPADIGYTLGVVTRNGLAWTKSYGQATTDTEYRIGTGALSAIMMLQLMRDGKVHLSDPAAKYVPELKSVRSRYPDAAPLTLMQLALHTTGLELKPSEKSLIDALPQAEFV